MFRVIAASFLPTQVFVSPETPCQDRFSTPSMEPELRAMTKPRGGLWTSSLTAAGSTDWIHFAGGPLGLRSPRCWIVRPEPDARIITIDRHADLRDLEQEYPWRSPLPEALHSLWDAPLPPGWTARIPGWERFLGPEASPLRAMEREIDFGRLAEDGYSGFWLTRRGLAETRSLLDTAPVLIGWDCECVLWLRWCFSEVAPLDPETV